jgi:hypothetical protein
LAKSLILAHIADSAQFPSRAITNREAAMKYDSASRLAHLHRVRDIRAKAARDAQNRRNDIIASLTAARRALEDAEAAALAVGYRERDATKGPVIAAKARVAELEAALTTADAEWRAARDASTDASQLFDAVAAYARDKGLPMPVKVGGIGNDPNAAARVQGEVRV